MKKLYSIKTACVAILASLASSVAMAAIIPVASVTASSTFYTYNVNNLINGAGLSGNLHSGDYQGKWITNGTVTGTLVFDLGANMTLGGTTIWNYGPGCCGAERSTKDLGISYSTDNVNFVDFANVVLANPTTDPFAGETFALNNIDARFIKFSLNSNYGDAYTGLSEVQFDGIAANVPEPATTALLGLGLLGFVASRRKSVKGTKA